MGWLPISTSLLFLFLLHQCIRGLGQHWRRKCGEWDSFFRDTEGVPSQKSHPPTEFFESLGLWNSCTWVNPPGNVRSTISRYIMHDLFISTSFKWPCVLTSNRSAINPGMREICQRRTPLSFLVQLGWLGKESLVRFLASAGSPYGWLTITVGHTKWKNKCVTVTTQSDRLKEYVNNRKRTFLTGLMGLENQIMIKILACQHGNMSGQIQISESDRRYIVRVCMWYLGGGFNI